MRLEFKSLVTLIFIFMSTGIVRGDSNVTTLQFQIDFGGQAANHTRLQLRFTDPQAIGEYVDIRLPLYASGPNEFNLFRFNAAETSKSFCERSQGSCIAFATLLGLGAVALVVKASEDERTDTRTQIQTGLDTGGNPPKQNAIATNK